MTEKPDLIGRKFPVLDDGFVTLIDFMGDDTAIANAARVSYGKGTRKVSEDRDLIRYLMRHKHSSPFEMCEIKIHIRVPMDVARQLWRHRTASINEYSTRYSEAIDASHATRPDAWRLQSKDNKQGSAGTVTEWPAGYRFEPESDGFGGEDDRIADGPMVVFYDPQTEESKGFKVFQDDEEPTPGGFLSSCEKSFQQHARYIYEQRLKFGVAREQARKDLPLSTMTEAFWKCDLRNVLGMLAQRMDGHAQEETRAYANVIGNEIVAKLFPIAWAAFQDYTLGAMTLTALDVAAIQYIQGGENFDDYWLTRPFVNRRERDECREKLIRLGVIGR